MRLDQQFGPLPNQAKNVMSDSILDWFPTLWFTAAARQSTSNNAICFPLKKRLRKYINGSLEKGALADSQSDHSETGRWFVGATPAGRFHKWSHISSLCPALRLIKRSGAGCHSRRPERTWYTANLSVAWKQLCKGPKDKSIYKPTSLDLVVLAIFKREAWFFEFAFSNASQAL